MKVNLTRSAQADLKAIARWIALDNPKRALSFPVELRRKCLGLGRNPRRFPVVARVNGGDIHKRVFKDYLVFYRVRPDSVDILQIVHGAMDWKAKLFGDPDPADADQ